MTIYYAPNDPNAGSTAPGLRTQAIRPNRAATRSGFTLSNPSPEGVFAPGTPQFLFWQCREAALAAVEAWELSAGPHKAWQGNRRRLPLLQDVGQDLNAFYDRASFSFFHQRVGAATFFSGASTDVVAHEVGHGLLDSIRPDYFSVNFLEVGAFHEAFGDCMAILTALADKESRVKLLAVAPNLRKRNFLESTAENLSLGIRNLIPGHNAGEPRHAFNNFKFQLPQTLPSNAGPGVLINEEHSFGMVFTGCFWSLIANLFQAAATQTEKSLSEAAVLAGQLLIAGARGAVLTPRFFQSVGRSMVLADQTLHSGTHRDVIGSAFTAHGIMLGTNAMLAPSTALDGKAPKGAKLDATTTKQLAARLGVTRSSTMNMAAANNLGQPAVNVTHEREVSVASVDRRLKGVMAMAHDSVVVGRSGTRAAVLGRMPNADNTDQEVMDYVATLMEHDRIDFGTKPKRSVTATSRQPVKTHKVVAQGRKKMLMRIGYRCGSH